jgi:hypothetical protein
MADEPMATELHMNGADLYREEVFTDRRVGSIRVMTPVKADGSFDATRKVGYVGEAQMLTPAGLIPLTFAIEANSLAEAVEKFSAGARQAVERTLDEIEQLRREAASSIIVPDRIPGNLRGGPPPGGARGGGKIQLP